MNVTDIYEDSPNGFKITVSAPAVVDQAIRYYLYQLDQFPMTDYPVEHGIINYSMGKLLFSDTSKPKLSEERAKRIENALYHFNQAFESFRFEHYPVMFAVISAMMGHLFRERALLVSERSFLAKRTTPEESIQFGVDHIVESFPVFFKSADHTHAHLIEHSLVCLEGGWLFTLQSEFLENLNDDIIREHALTYLERSISLYQEFLEEYKQQEGEVARVNNLSKHALKNKKNTEPILGIAPLNWKPHDRENYPHHVKILLEGHDLSYILGSATYVLGRLYEGWGNSLENQEKAFEYYCQCVRPKYLPMESPLWADAHHRAASLAIKNPQIINPDFIPPGTPGSPGLRSGGGQLIHGDLMQSSYSDIHIDSAISHLSLALRCPSLTNSRSMDVYFHRAQAYIAKLQNIIDRVPPGESITRAIAGVSSNSGSGGAGSGGAGEMDGLEIIDHIKDNLKSALGRVTAASTQSTQDGYLYFFACMKLSEFRMLEAACVPNLVAAEREQHLQDAVEYLIDGLIARPLADNADLHYIATVQMSQMLLGVRRSYAASKSYAKALLCLSVIINRSLYSPENTFKRLSDEALKQVSQALLANASAQARDGSMPTRWIKLHYGPLKLHERAASGYATWSFEYALSVEKYKKKTWKEKIFGGKSAENGKIKGKLNNFDQKEKKKGGTFLGIFGSKNKTPAKIKESEEKSEEKDGKPDADAPEEAKLSRNISDLANSASKSDDNMKVRDIDSLEGEGEGVEGEELGDDHTSLSSALYPFTPAPHPDDPLSKPRSPPKGVPPLLLPVSPSKKVTIKGETITDDFREGNNALVLSKLNQSGSGKSVGPRPPPGAVPLSAMGHHPLAPDPHSKSTALSTGVLTEEEIRLEAEGITFYKGPYGRRRRRKIPPSNIMHEVDTTNAVTFTLPKGKKAFLLPNAVNTHSDLYTKPAPPPPPLARKMKKYGLINGIDGRGRDSRMDKDAVESKRKGAKVRVQDPKSSWHPDESAQNSTLRGKKDKEKYRNGKLGEDAGTHKHDTEAALREFELSRGVRKKKKSNHSDSDSDNSVERWDGEHKDRGGEEGSEEEEGGGDGREGSSDGEGESEEEEEEEDLKIRRNTSKNAASSLRFTQTRATVPDDIEADLRRRLRENKAQELETRRIELQRSLADSHALKKARNSQGVLSWIYSAVKSDKDAASVAANRGAYYSSAQMKKDRKKRNRQRSKRGFGLFPFSREARKAKTGEKSDGVEGDELGFWASTPCYYAFMALSRHSRMHLVLRGNRLNVLDGERANYMLYKFKTKVTRAYLGLRRNLLDACDKLIVPPTSLKDLSNRSFPELKVLFSSQVKIAKKLTDLERFLFGRILAKYDHFVPMLCCVPTFSRDIVALDDTLLNSFKLILNLGYEDSLLQSNLERDKAEREKKTKQKQLEIQKKGQKGKKYGGNDEELGQTQQIDKHYFVNDEDLSTVQSSQVATVGKGSVSFASPAEGGEDESDPEKAAVMRDQLLLQEEELEEVHVGKMTLSMSELLDGSASLRGAKDVLGTHLSTDECLMLWHVPHAATHTLQVVLIWRDNSASTHGFYSSAEAAAMREDMQKHRKYRREQRKKEQKLRQKDAQNGKLAEHDDEGNSYSGLTAEEWKRQKLEKETKSDMENYKNRKQSKSDQRKKERSTWQGRKGIVMELAKSDLDAAHIYHLLQNYLQALQARPAPLRLTLCTDALRSLSCALSVSEFLHMLPPHIRSFVICCPPQLRAVPWNLLLIEIPNPLNKPDTSQAAEKDATADPSFRNNSTDNYDVLRDRRDKALGTNVGAESDAGAGVAAVGSPSKGGQSMHQIQGVALPAVIEVHLLEKFCVRLGPSLSLFELCGTDANMLRHTVGLHRLVAVDGEVGDARSPGVRGTDLEIACVGSTWSADPEDVHILTNEGAAPAALQTGLFHIRGKPLNEARYRRFKREAYMPRREPVDLLKIPEEEAEEEGEDERGREGGGRQEGNSRLRVVPGGVSAGQGGGEKEDDEGEESDASYDSAESEERLELEAINLKALTMCRVLHIAAPKIMHNPADKPAKSPKKEGSPNGRFQAPYTSPSGNINARKNGPNSGENTQNGGINSGEGALVEAALSLPCAAVVLASSHTDPHANKHKRTDHTNPAIDAGVGITGSLVHKKVTKTGEYFSTKSGASGAYFDTIAARKKARREKEAAERRKKRALERIVKDDDSRDCLTTSDVIKQIYVKNCALCVLSRFGVTDDMSDIRTADRTMEFLESMHLAGASTLLYPLWGGSGSAGKGIGVLGNLIFMIRFYVTLPNFSKDRLSVGQAVRRAQLWLRNATADDIISFIAKIPVPRSARETIISEMETYVSASLTSQSFSDAKNQQNRSSPNMGQMDNSRASFVSFTTSNKNAAQVAAIVTAAQTGHPTPIPGSPDSGLENGSGMNQNAAKSKDRETRGNRVGGDRRFFSHFLHWGAFQVSGYGGGVHHPNLTEDMDDDDIFQGMAFPDNLFEDEELNNIEFEAAVLRMEGKIAEAKVLEERIRELRAERLRKQIAQARATGARAKRGLLDGLDYLDKAFLDQDSDSISLSESEAESSDQDSEYVESVSDSQSSDSYDSDDPLNNNRTRRKKKLRKRLKPRSLDLGKLTAEDIEYRKWKAKVGNLNMNLKSRVLPIDLKGSGSKDVQDEKGRSSGVLDQKNAVDEVNFEYNMQQATKDSNDPDYNSPGIRREIQRRLQEEARAALELEKSQSRSPKKGTGAGGSVRRRSSASAAVGKKSGGVSFEGDSEDDDAAAKREVRLAGEFTPNSGTPTGKSIGAGAGKIGAAENGKDTEKDGFLELLRRPSRSSDEDSSASDQDSDEEESEFDDNGFRKPKSKLKQGAKVLKKEAKKIRKEVRSYAEAAETAKKIFMKLPPILTGQSSAAIAKASQAAKRAAEKAKEAAEARIQAYKVHAQAAKQEERGEFQPVGASPTHYKNNNSSSNNISVLGGGLAENITPQRSSSFLLSSKTHNNNYSVDAGMGILSSDPSSSHNSPAFSRFQAHSRSPSPEKGRHPLEHRPVADSPDNQGKQTKESKNDAYARILGAHSGSVDDGGSDEG